jgi:hypothetical protein
VPICFFYEQIHCVFAVPGSRRIYKASNILSVKNSKNCTKLKQKGGALDGLVLYSEARAGLAITATTALRKADELFVQ